MNAARGNTLMIAGAHTVTNDVASAGGAVGKEKRTD
jgi:hypothetical protein